MDIFQDQARFMQACGQTVHVANADQFKLYVSLIAEELEELQQAHAQQHDEQVLDALIDIMVVTVGAMLSTAHDAQSAWQAVMDSNLAKIDSFTGEVLRREDGKILKPEGWTPPDLSKFINTLAPWVRS